MPGIAHVSDQKTLFSEAARYIDRYGANPYSNYIHAHRKRPSRDQAATIGRLMGTRVRAEDGSLQPLPTKKQREASRVAKLARQAEAQIDAELSRALDAITFLSENELNALPIIARISPDEAALLTAQLKKAVEWLNRFAEGWQSHVCIGNIASENRAAGDSEQPRRGELRLVSSRD